MMTTDLAFDRPVRRRGRRCRGTGGDGLLRQLHLRHGPDVRRRPAGGASAWRTQSAHGKALASCRAVGRAVHHAAADGAAVPRRADPAGARPERQQPRSLPSNICSASPGASLPALWFIAIRGFMSARQPARADPVDHPRGDPGQRAVGLSPALRRMGIAAARVCSGCRRCDLDRQSRDLPGRPVVPPTAAGRSGNTRCSGASGASTGR